MTTIWHQDGVASAVGRVRDVGSLLVVLTTHVSDREKTVDEVLARESSRALEEVSFGSAMTKAALALHNAFCLRLKGSDEDGDYKNFKALFSVPCTPCLHIIAPDGRVLVERTFFTSPTALVRALDFSARKRDGETVEMPDLGPALHKRRPLPRRQKPATRPRPTPARATPSTAGASTATTTAATTATMLQVPEARDLPSAAGAMQLGERARLQLRLPGGGTATRSFNADTTFRDVTTWATDEMGDASDVRLSVAFPRRTFDAADLPKTLRELSLLPSATLIATRAESRGILASVSASGSMIRGAVGAAGSILGAFVGGGSTAQSNDQNDGDVPDRPPQKQN